MKRFRPFQLGLPLACLLIVLFPQAGASELKPDTISPAHRSGSEPQLVSNGSGDVVAVWRDLDDNAESIRATFRPRVFDPQESMPIAARGDRLCRPTSTRTAPWSNPRRTIECCRRA